MSVSDYLSSIDDVVETARQGQMFILVDDESRENEGDLIIPAEKATAASINFMAKYGRGLICLALTPARIDDLGLSLMSPKNETRHQTAFTVSIEAREGVTTGISAADRARTIAVAIDPAKGRGDIVSPGHIFPLVAEEGGVLVRAGHTEAAVDIARMAGLDPSGVVCEVMNDDGTMARLPDLVKFAQLHGLKVATISDIIAHRRRHEKLIERVTETTITSRYGGEFKLYLYINRIAYAEHIALVKGDIAGPEPVLVRMHALNVLGDVLGDTTVSRFGGGEARNRGGELQAAMGMIGEAGRGVVVMIREAKATSLSDFLKQRQGKAAIGPAAELRDYGVGAQILLDLGVKEMILLSNSKRSIIALEGHGLNLVDQLPIVLPDA